jgi:hypothetical protein
LNRPPGLLLYDNRPSADLPATDQLTGLDLHHVTGAQLAVDREIEQISISKATMLVKIEADRPDAWK